MVNRGGPFNPKESSRISLVLLEQGERSKESCLSRIPDCLMHETKCVLQREAMGSGSCRITADERSDSRMFYVSGLSLLIEVMG